MRNPNLPGCTERVPQALSGALSGAERPTCSRYRGHIGKHRASITKRGVGTTSWEWKTQPVVVAESRPPMYDGFGAPISNPVTPTRNVGKPFVSAECECRGMVHICAAFRGLVR